jgi:hypothetical protein
MRERELTASDPTVSWIRPFIARSREFALLALLLACVFDPTGTVSAAKYIFFAIWMLLGLVWARREAGWRPSTFTLGYVGLLAFVLPLYGLITAAIRGGLNGEFTDTSYFTSGLFLLYAVFLAPSSMVNMAVNQLLLALRLLSLTMVCFALLLVMGLADSIAEWVRSWALAVITERDYGGVTFPYIYFVTSPMLVFLLASDAWRAGDHVTARNVVLACVTASALFLSGTRANMAMSLIGPISVLAWRKGGWTYGLLSFCFAMVAALVLLGATTGVFRAMISPEEAGNAVKLGYLPYYKEIFSDPLVLVFGQGLNARLWSGPVIEMWPESPAIPELTYLELIRVFGIVVAGAVVIALFGLAIGSRMARSSFPFIGAGLFLYLVLAFSNPYIFSSNGMLLIGMALAVAAAANPARSRT